MLRRAKGKGTLVALFGDTQCGSILGLMPPTPWQKQEGGTHHPGLVQQVLYQVWTEYWQEVAGQQAARRILIHGGDAIEGVHHETTQLVTLNIDEQERIYSLCLDHALKIINYNEKMDKMYMISGTETHVGAGASSEERIARDFDMQPHSKGTPENEYMDGRYTHPHFLNHIDGVLFDVAHHGPGRGTRAWTSENSLYNTIKSIYWSRIEKGKPVPRFWVRFHKHQFTHAVYTRNGEVQIEGFIMPCFQAKTSFVHKIGWSSDLESTFGGLFFKVGNGEPTWNKVILEYEDQEPGSI